MLLKQQRKIKRSAKLISVLSKYGFKDILVRMNISKTEVGDDDLMLKNSVYTRIRMALEELGPTFVKLGQTFSNREDLLPKELITELQKLQDKVEIQPIDVKTLIEEEFNLNADDFFQEIPENPLAAASIAQVYKAVLKDQTPVILKVKRPNARATIEDDLLLIKDLVQILTTYTDIGERINLSGAIAVFEKSILEELSLVNEKNNILQFQQNFKNNTETYVPKIYEKFSNDNILCMEFIDGLKVTDAAALIDHHIDPVKISETGLRLFVSQILDFGFFHADPHAGNILVKEDGRIVFIDFGAVGKIPKQDQEVLENLITAFVSKNTPKIIRNLKKMAVSYEIPDERRFEADVSDVLEFVHNTSLEEINVGILIAKMRLILTDNRLYMPDYFYLLFKGISLIEGVGRTINPDLDVVTSLKPFAKKILYRKFKPENLWNSGLSKAMNFADYADEIPQELRSVLQQVNESRLSIQTEVKNLEKTNQILKTNHQNLILTMLICANILATALLLSTNMAPKIAGINLFACVTFLVSVVFSILLGLRLLRK